MAFLKDRTLADSELLTALAALPQAMTLFAFGVLFGGLRADTCQAVSLINNATVWANRTIRSEHVTQPPDPGRSGVESVPVSFC